MDFNQLLQLLLSGISQGGIYALIAVGYITIYNVTGIINFAQGEFVTLGALTTVTLHGAGGLPLPAAALLAIVLVILFGLLMERTVIYPAGRKGASLVTMLIITLGISTAIKGVALLYWGTDPLSLEAFSPGEPIKIFGASFVRQNFWILGATALVFGGLSYFFERTFLGKSVRACVINKNAAQLMGISPQKMSLLAFGISAGVGALAGVVIVPITMANYQMGLMLGLKGFVAAVLGGLNSFTGAIIGGLILGVSEALGAGYISSGYKDAIAFLFLLIILFVKPSGLLGVIGGKRV